MFGLTYLPVIVNEDRISHQCSVDLWTYVWIDLPAVIVNEDRISHQCSVDLWTYVWIDLLAVIVNEDRISHQSSVDLWTYVWIDLLPVIVNEDRISHQSSMDLWTYVWIDFILSSLSMHMFNTTGSYQPSMQCWIYGHMFGLTYSSCNSKRGSYQSRVSSMQCGSMDICLD